MLKQNDIYIGRPLIYTLCADRGQVWSATVIYIDEDGFYLGFPDGDKTYVWYEYDMALVTPLEIKCD